MSVENPLSDPLKPPPEAPRNFGFNWGALGLGAGWLFGHGKVYLGAGFILLYYFFKLLQFPLPLIILFFLPIHIFLAFTGNKIAWKYHHAESKADVRRGERWWTIGGIIATVLAALTFYVGMREVPR